MQATIARTLMAVSPIIPPASVAITFAQKTMACIAIKVIAPARQGIPASSPMGPLRTPKLVVVVRHIVVSPQDTSA